VVPPVAPPEPPEDPVTALAKLREESALAKTEAETFRAALAKERDDLAKSNGELAGLKTKLEADLASASAAKAEAEKAKAAAELARDAARKEAAELREQAARFGSAPPAKLPHPGTLPDGTAKTLARADFERMTPAMQSKFCKDGGKLTD
jgi:septal ring factor EnvC (AmiA/AmiB activator)